MTGCLCGKDSERFTIPARSKKTVKIFTILTYNNDGKAFEVKQEVNVHVLLNIVF